MFVEIGGGNGTTLSSLLAESTLRGGGRGVCCCCCEGCRVAALFGGFEDEWRGAKLPGARGCREEDCILDSGVLGRL